MTLSDLLQKKCVPCEGGVPALDISEIHKYQKKIDGWDVIKNEKNIHLFEGGYSIIVRQTQKNGFFDPP